MKLPVLASIAPHERELNPRVADGLPQRAPELGRGLNLRAGEAVASQEGGQVHGLRRGEVFLEDAPWRAEVGIIHLLASCGQAWALRSALTTIDEEPPPFSIQSVDQLLSFRTGFMRIETGWSNARVNWEMLAKYNDRVRLMNAPRSIVIKIPPRPPSN